MKYFKLNIIFIFLLLAITACNSSSTSSDIDDGGADSSDTSGSDTDSSGSDSSDSGSDTDSSGSDSSDSDSDTGSSDINILTRHDEASDYVWDEPSATQIVLNGSSISVDGSGASAEGSILTISAAGQYSMTGTLNDGQIIIDSEDGEAVKIKFNNISINSNSSSPFFVKNAEKTIILLADNTENHVTDGVNYIYEDAEEDEPNAAIFSKDDLTIYGGGTLIVNANYNDGIKSKDGLIIESGTISISSVDDSILGKDYLLINDGNITVNAQGDGLKSTNDDDAEKGYILIEGGTFNLSAANDAIQAETSVLVNDGDFAIITGDGSNAFLADDVSAKGIKSGVDIVVTGGDFTLDSADDTIHSNSSITINGGTFSLASGDDGIHADGTVEINGGEIDITQSVEGIEGVVIIINDGDIQLVSSDDGINAAGNDDSNHQLYINGGRVFIDADGDGIDANGTIEMSGGVVIVNGPTADNNGAIDYDTSFKITGGVLIATGSSRMAQAPSNSSTQNSVSISLNRTLAANTLIHLETSSGEEILTFKSTKNYQSLVFSSAELVSNSTYDIYYGGSSTGTETSGLYEGGTYSPGTEYGSFTVSSVVTNVR